MTKVKALFVSIAVCALALGAAWAQSSPESGTQENAAEPEKVMVEVNEKILDKDLPSYKTNLKEIIREAQTNLKKVDGTIKSQDDEKSAKERFDQAGELIKEGKFEEARNEYEAARKLTSNTSFKKSIRESEQKIAGKAKDQERSRIAEEKAKAKAEAKAKVEAKEPEAKKEPAEAKAAEKPAEKAAEKPAEKAAQREVKAKPSKQRQPVVQKAERRYGTEVQPKSRADRPVVAAKPVKQAETVKMAEPVKEQDEAAAKASEEAAAKAKADAEAMARAEAERKAQEEADARAKAETEAKESEVSASAESARLEAETNANAEAETKAKEAAEAAAKIAAEAPKPETVAIGTAKADQPTTQISIEAPGTKSAAGFESAPPIVAAGPDMVSNLYREAVSLYWDNKYEEAKSKFEEVQKLSPDYARTAYYLGRVKEKLGK